MIKLILDSGELEIELYEETPLTRENFMKLIKEDFYTDLVFHRVIPQFVVQGGCPEGTGRGSAGYTIDCEVDKERQYHDRGVLSMAHAGKNTGSSQFFICINRHHTRHLDGIHTCFGRVKNGIELIDSIKQGDKFSIKIKST